MAQRLGVAADVSVQNERPASGGRRWRRRPSRGQATALVVLLGLLAAGWALAETLDTSGERLLPTPGAAGLAAALCIAWFVALGMSWLRMFPGTREAHHLIGAAWLSQLAKYLPVGGVAQAGAQIGLGRDSRTRASVAAVIFPVWLLVVVVGAAALGPLLAIDVAAPTWARWLGAASGLAVLLLWRPWVRVLLDAIRRVSPRIPEASAIPEQTAMLRSFAWSVVMTGAWGLALAVLVRDLEPDASIAGVTGAYALAWIAGFLVIPLPAGAGVREVVLIALLGPAYGPDVVLAAAISHRVISIAVEIAVVSIDRATTLALARARPAGARRQ